MALSPAVCSLLREFHASRPVRVWSLIVTLYGDAIVPRGGTLWLGSLTTIMALFGIDAGHVRTAMSRLTADGWLERNRMGRNSYYRLSKRGEGSFRDATRRIYSAEERPFDGHLRVALIAAASDERAAIRPGLEQAGFAALSPGAHVGLDDPPAAIAGTAGLFVVKAEAGEGCRNLAAAAWKLAPIAVAYHSFLERFGPIEAGLAREAPDPASALVARTLLIHEFRRVVLRDPALPAVLLPTDWPGGPARDLAGRLYRRVVSRAEVYLDAHATAEDGPLPPTDAAFAARFGETVSGTPTCNSKS